MQQIAVEEQRIAGIHLDIDQLKAFEDMFNAVEVSACLVAC